MRQEQGWGDTLLRAVIGRVGEGGEETGNEAWVDRVLVVGASASAVVCDKDDLFLTDLLLDCLGVAFL